MGENGRGVKRGIGLKKVVGFKNFEKCGRLWNSSYHERSKECSRNSYSYTEPFRLLYITFTHYD